MLRTVLDTIPQRVFWKDRNSIYLGGNSGYLADAGLPTPEEVVGKSDFELPWRDPPAHFEMKTGRLSKPTFR